MPHTSHRLAVTGSMSINNEIPFYWYFDLRLSYRWDNGLTLYGAIDNVADKIHAGHR